EIESFQASLVEPGEQALFFAVADDRRFRPGSGDPEPSQRIVGGRIHEQDLQGPLVAIMAAADGSFDSEREEMLGAVDSGGRAPGRYLLVAQAEDESGARGPGIGQWLE
ncbi:hypothetical protein RZS08_02680, partial [Arthrospira platensis SPKY1]|nr:hypothetical protein [Arthrospira platensis SPKY1]